MKYAYVMADGGACRKPELVGHTPPPRPPALGVANHMPDPWVGGVGEHRKRGSLHHMN